MLFNSFHFLFYFLVVVAVFFNLPQKFRRPFLLLSSCYFYMAFVPQYILILFGVIIIDFIAGIEIEKSEGFRRRLFLTLSLGTNISILCIFKYYNFFADNLTNLFTLLGLRTELSHLGIILPIGLSFHTFQAMAYTIEVYRKRVAAERRIDVFALYVLFFPQLVAGPIERPQNLLQQFHRDTNFDYGRAVDGARLMLWGLFKKMVIADNCAVLANHVFNGAQHFQYHGRF